MAEAANTAIYSLNRATLNEHNKTPYESWMGKKPKISHMKTFGAMAYVPIPDIQRRKVEYKAKKMVMVGYQKESTNYRLYDPERRKIVKSRECNIR